MLRPPRVAVLFRSDEHWKEWARHALAFVSQAWGGLGFVLVPYDPNDGGISPRLVEALVVYDPDHVVALDIPMSDWERIAPGVLRLRD